METTKNPYAPPKAVSNGNEYITYLEHDGYSFGSDLVANQYFKSPPICVKLGIALDNDTEMQPSPVEVMRLPMHRGLSTLIFLAFSTCLYLALYFAPIELKIILFLGTVIVFTVFKYLIRKPYQISFYFSDQYLRRKKRRDITFKVVFFLSSIAITSGYMTQSFEAVGMGIIGFIITYIIYIFKIKQFTVTLSKGEFHYVRGIHQNLLDSIPPLPLSPRLSGAEY